jgi:hypothetical protein
MTRVVIDPYHLLNPFYGRFGVRPIWHIPCSFRCAESKMLASDYLKLWDGEEKEWLDEILSWPLEWSSLHGAAETRTPVCKIISESKPESVEHVIQYVGRGYPDQMLRGNRFPYNREEDDYSNNGFHNPESMKHYHEIIFAASQQAGQVMSISDPGCGNGALLHRLSKWHLNAKLNGTDFNHHAIAQGRRLYPNVDLTEGNLFNHYSSGDMVVFMPGRLLENPDRAERFVRELNFRYLLLYGYSAYASKVMGLKKQYWPDCKEVTTIINDDAVATLLEKP